MKPLLLCMVVPAALAGIAQAQTRIGHNQTVQSRAEPGQETRIFGYAHWSPDCQPLEPPRIVLQTPPAHGTVSVRPGESHVDKLRPGAPDCTGRTMPATTIWYRPQPGFHGTDQFEYDVLSGRDISRDTVIVQVR